MTQKFMKWFKHFSDAYSNLKLQSLKGKYGMTGYGFYWTVLELVAQQGINFEINSKKNWRDALVAMSGLKEEVVDEMLKYFADSELIDKKAYKQGGLFLPKLKEYSDEYTAKVGRMSRHNRDNVVLEEEVEEDKNKLDKNSEVTPTPAEQTRNFFTYKDKQQEVINYLIASGVPADIVSAEVKNFISYWTELTKSGKKQRWELQPTFELKRRFATWFKNYKTFNPKSQEKGHLKL